MSLIINNNIASLLAQRNLSKNTSELTKSFERLSSGYRINRASDDAAGLAISESLRSQIRGNNMADSNIQEGINLLQAAEGGLNVVNDNIQRIRELCVQAANETNGSTEKDAILSEVRARLADIDRIARVTTYNNITLLSGATSNVLLQIGCGTVVSTNTLNVGSALSNVQTSTLTIGIASSVDGSNWTSTQIRAYIDNIDSAIKEIQNSRASIGAYQNRLQSSLNNLSVMTENLQSSESRIRDVDLAQETATMTKFQILQRASVSVLAQANQSPQIALSLLS